MTWRHWHYCFYIFSPNERYALHGQRSYGRSDPIRWQRIPPFGVITFGLVESRTEPNDNTRDLIGST